MKGLCAIILTVTVLMVHFAAFTQTVFNGDANTFKDHDFVEENHIHINRQKGFFGMIESGVVAGDDFRLRFNAIGGYFVFPWLSTGIGAGVRHFLKGGKGPLTVPLFADIRFYPWTHHSRFFISGGAGPSFYLYDGRNNPFLFLNLTVGTGVPITSRINLNFSLGYEMHEIIIMYLNGKPLIIKSHGANANIGISF